jgi:hypothetical protein
MTEKWIELVKQDLLWSLPMLTEATVGSGKLLHKTLSKKFFLINFTSKGLGFLNILIG